jgi:hypothetical protein
MAAVFVVAAHELVERVEREDVVLEARVAISLMFEATCVSRVLMLSPSTVTYERG